MEHTIQMGKECALAAVCILLDKHYGKTKDDFRIKHGITFGDAADSFQHAHLCVAYLNALGLKADWFRNKGKARYGPPDLTGAGIFTICYANGQRHAVAYRNGKVHDPGFLYAMPYEQWKSRHRRRFYIDGQERII
jgi:hypothetical protein